MSKIAEALAKAKERTGHTTAPFLSGAPVVPAELAAKKEAALRRARRLQRFWLTLSTLALLLTGVIIWSRLDEIRSPGAANKEKATGTAETAPAAGAPPKVNIVVEAPVAVVLPDAPSASGSAAGPVAPTPELQAEVNALIFTAVMPGERPRLMFKGRIVHPGERVEGELVFAGIHDGRLVFNDARGAIYLRRY